MDRISSWLLYDGDRSPERIGERVRARVSAPEAIVAASLVAILVLSARYPGHGIDWEVYAGAADGRFSPEDGLDYYYAYWLLPIFDLFALPGLVVGGVVWGVANVAGAWFAARVFGARPAVVLAGFGAISAFYTGTITGVALGAMGALWWALTAQRWLGSGALALVAAAKPQWGAPLVATLVLQSRPPVTAWLRLAVAPVMAFGVTLAVYGFWPADIVERAGDNPPAGNGSLWHFIGPAVLVLWLAVLLPLGSRSRLVVVASLSLLAVPYVQQYDHMVLWVLAADGLGLLSFAAPAVQAAAGDEVARATQTLLPLAVYMRIVAPALVTVTAPLRARAARRRRPGTAAPSGSRRSSRAHP